MVTSAGEQEGKSTTIANLAVALARSGRHVVLVDLDLRRPYLNRFFELGGPGITQVALGQVSLDDALETVAITEPSPGRPYTKPHVNGNGNGNGARRATGLLEVLPSGPIPPDPGEFVGTEALTEILEQLRERADVVLVDAPPMLHVGDAITLSSKVDAIVVVTRIKTLRRQMLGELARQLSTVPTRVVGYIATGGAPGESYGYESGYGYGYRRGHYSSHQADHDVRAHARDEA
jgi:non-specific protein-tyrosine kinase